MPPTAETLDRMRTVAQLRVEGATWDAIAEKFGYKHGDSACSTITQGNKAEWQAIYEEVRADLLDTVEAEALLTQRSLLRSADERVKQAAAHSLLNHCRQLRAQQINITGALRHDVNVGALRPPEECTLSEMLEAYAMLARGNGALPNVAAN